MENTALIPPPKTSRVTLYVPDPDELQTDYSKAPDPESKLLSELVRPIDDKNPNELLEHRFLCRGGGLLLCGPTGIGKSSWAMQCKILWALGRECFGIKPAGPLKSLLIQAENDDGDLAEMRDGVIQGLGLSEQETKTACDNIIVVREDSHTGSDFFRPVVRPLLEIHRPDLLWIDPVFAYLGAEAGAQKDVTPFLRNNLNPLVREFNCGVVVVHHTNKPSSGREKPKLSGHDLAYLGSGSIEWANWARAIIVFCGLGKHDLFELRAAKRGSRLGWHEADGSTCYAKLIAHSKQPGIICWRYAEPNELPSIGGRPQAADVSELVGLLDGRSLTDGEFQKLAMKELKISKATFYRRKQMALEKGLISQSPDDKKFFKIP